MEEKISLEINETTLPVIKQMSELMPVGFYIGKSETGEIIYCNKELMHMAGCETEEEFIKFTGNIAQNFIVEQDSIEVAQEIARNTEKKVTELKALKFKIKRKDGLHCWVKAYGDLLKSETFGDIFYIFMEDYTEAMELDEARKQAVFANEAKLDFLINVSHDVRTPMNAIVGFTNLLEHKAGDKELSLKYIKKIQYSTNILNELIDNILEMAHIEKGQIQLDEKRYHVEEFNDALFSVFEFQMKQKGINYNRIINIKHDYVWCDSVKLKQIYLNILGNAYKFTNPGGSVSMKLQEVQCDRPGYALYRTVIEDTGIGMSKDFIPHIFESFSRERNSSANNIEGSGLGMAIVEKYVKLMGGTIDVESKLGVGTKIIVSIPHKIVTEQEAKLSDSISDIPDTILKGKRILLAEDNDLNAEITMTILGEFGIQVNRAKDGQDCLNMLKIADPDDYALVLMDIQMPVMDGYEAAKAIRQMEDPVKANIPIIAATANAFEEDKQKAISAGMNGHVAKPINVNILIKTMEEHYNRSHIE